MKIILVILINIIYYILYIMGQFDIEQPNPNNNIPNQNNNQSTYSIEINYFVYIVVFFTAYSIVPSIMMTLKNNKNEYQNNTYNSTNSNTIDENNKSKITIADRIVSIIICALISSSIGTLIIEIFLK